MAPLVTVAIPVYKRLGYLPGALRSVAAQDYPEIELIVSDNGEHGATLDALVAAHYPRPYRLRRNQRSVPIVEHFNQLIDSASGVYYAMLSDDDEISPTFIGELVRLLERYPEATAALARVEAFSEDGARVLAATDDAPLPPELMSGMAFVRAWCTHQHKFISFTTNLSRTADLRAAGGYPPIERANGSDNALLIKQSLGRAIAFSARCTFRHRMHATSFGKAAEIESLARSSRQFLAWLAEDPGLRAWGQQHAAEYAELRELAAGLAYGTYLARWRGLYRGQISGLRWVLAGFRLPFHPRYTRQAAATVLYSLPGLDRLARRHKRPRLANR
ncbi:MAG: glycosyltransferase family A protein [Chloroflexi bacterium OHK40]